MNKIEQLTSRFNEEELRKKLITKSGDLVYRLFRLVFLFSMCFIILYPVLYMISVAIRQSADLYDPTVIWVPKHFTFENFTLVVDALDYWRLLGNTLFYSTVSTLFSVVSCALAGYGFARFTFKFKGILFALLLFTLIVPPQLVSIPMYLQYAKFDFFGIGWVVQQIVGAEANVNLLNTPLTLFIPAILGSG